MTRHPALRLIRRHPIAQIGLVTAFWLAGEAASRLSGLGLPGGVLGLALVLALLATGRLKPASMKRGADWLLREMLLFFVPAVLTVLNHPELFGLLGLKILAVILLSTIAVMAATALAVDACFRWNTPHAPLAHPR